MFWVKCAAVLLWLLGVVYVLRNVPWDEAAPAPADAAPAIGLSSAGMTHRGYRTGDPAFDKEVALVGPPAELLRLDASTRELLRRFTAQGGTFFDGRVILPFHGYMAHRRRMPHRERRSLLYGVEAAMTRVVSPQEVVAVLEEPLVTVGVRAMRLLLANPRVPDQATILATYIRRCGVPQDAGVLVSDLSNLPAPLGLWVLDRLRHEGTLEHVAALKAAMAHEVLGRDAGQALAAVRARHAHAHVGGLALADEVPVGGLSPASGGGELAVVQSTA